MDRELIFVIGVFWLTSTAYVIYYHNKHYKLSIETIIWAIFFGPIIALIMKNPEEESVAVKNIEEHIENKKHRRWFRTIPPPPTISQPPNRRPDIKKDFKFFRG